MALEVNLWTKKTGDIKKFLQAFYQKEVKMDDDVEQWIYVFNNPLEAIDIISAVIDNSDKYQINMCLQIDKGDVHPITYDNHNDIIKGIFYLYYQDSMELLDSHSGL
jgi:hypothetical protein